VISTNQLDTPVLFVVFNRPQMTAAVLRALQTVRPKRLLVAADGPRSSHPADQALCAETRQLVDRLVDWPCEITRRYAPENQGCGVGVSTAIAWALEQFEEVIILEDDCVPNPHFFPFVGDMLDRYRNEDSVMLVSGCNLLEGRKALPYSYGFSRYTQNWGWATWRRAWTKYDFSIAAWPQIRDAGLLADLLGDKREAEYWRRNFESVRSGHTDTWDYQLQLTMWSHHRLAIYPASNLITNIGTRGVHFSREGPLHNVPTQPLDFPLRHPPMIYRDVDADRLNRSIWYLPTLSERIRRKASRQGWHLRRAGTARNRTVEVLCKPAASNDYC